MKYWKSHKNWKNSVSIYLMLVEAYFQACLAGVWVDFPCFELVSIVDVSQKWCLAQAEKCNPSTFNQNLPDTLYYIKSPYYTVFENHKKVSFNIAGEAAFCVEKSSLKMPLIFEKLELVKNAQIKNFKYNILVNFQTMWNVGKGSYF